MQAGINFLYEPRERSHFGTEYRKAPPPRKGQVTSLYKGKEKLMGIKRVAGCLKPAPDES
jgi:hypothetical protein